MRSRKSILLVTVDCLRADHVGFNGYSRPTTPFLDTLAKESAVIPTAIVAGAPTYYSLPAILASRFPLALGRDVLGLVPGEPSLATVLQDAGYATAAFVAGNPYISTRFGYEQGFAVFRDFLEPEAASVDGQNSNVQSHGWAGRINRGLQKARPAMGFLGRLYDDLYFEYCQYVTATPSSFDALRRFPSAEVIVDHACAWLSSINDVPFFLWLHLMDPHSPYYPKESALSLLGRTRVTPRHASYLNSSWNRSDLGPQRLERHRDEIVTFYDAGIRWVDEQLHRLVDSLRSSNRWDHCVFALTADHGEEFLEHGGRYHPPSGLAEELIHVPLLLRTPGGEKSEQSKSPFSLVHLAPTLLDAAELPSPPTFKGRSYMEQIRAGHPVDDSAISECVAGCTNPFRPENRMGARILSVREHRFKLVIDFHTGTDSLYDLGSDRGERNPLPPGDQKHARRRLLEVAREHLHRSIQQRDHGMRLHAQLRELRLELPRSLAVLQS